MTMTYIVMPPHGGSYPYTAEVINEMARDREGILFKNLLGTLSFFFFLFFLGSLYNTLRKAEGGTGWLSLLALGGGLVLTAVHSLETVVSYAVAWHVASEGNVAVVTALRDIEDLVAYYSAVPLAVMLVAASIVVYRTQVLPRWIAWLGFMAGVVWLVGAAGVLDPQNGPLTAVGFGGGIVLYVLLWIPATSIALMRQPDVAEQLSKVAPAGTVPAGAR
jgi:hypothetical protein